MKGSVIFEIWDFFLNYNKLRVEVEMKVFKYFREVIFVILK